MKIKPTDKFTLSTKELEKQEFLKFLKRISNLKWDNAEVIIPNSVNNQKNNSESK